MIIGEKKMEELITNPGRLRIFKFSRFNASDYKEQVDGTIYDLDDDDMSIENKNDSNISSNEENGDEEKQKVYIY